MAVTGSTTIHYVRDMSRAVNFYEQVLDLAVTSKSPGWSTLRLSGGCELALHIKDDVDSGSTPHPFDALETTLALSVDNLDECVERVISTGGEHVLSLIHI